MWSSISDLVSAGVTEPHDHDRGLAFDLATLLDRRSALRMLAGVGAFVLVGCGDDGDDTASSTTTATQDAGGTTSTTTGGATSATCEEIPSETAGPFPGDGSNGPNALTESGVVRRDITSSFGGSSGKAEGVPLTINLVIQDQGGGCQPLAGAAVYVWHCDREGRYSMYSEGAIDQNYLRGVQETDASGKVSFTSIFPAAYPGRWPHVHFEVYRSVADATAAGNPIATSQLALPQDACVAVYATAGYEASVRNLAQTSLSSDQVFRDGSDQQLAAMTGSAGAGYTASLTVPV